MEIEEKNNNWHKKVTEAQFQHFSDSIISMLVIIIIRLAVLLVLITIEAVIIIRIDYWLLVLKNN